MNTFLMNIKSNKTLKSKIITLGLVVGVYIIMQVLLSAGAVSSLIKGLLVPLCTFLLPEYGLPLPF